ncbi:MAG: hypothetical protein HYZ75_05515 [Elusimicrobia bacterium]|nr:hypothetical protein [Elusimicrobiota bacterium]
MRALFVLLLAASAVPAGAQLEPPPIQRYLENLKLGDRLQDVKIVYPPVRDWSTSREPSWGGERITIQRGQAKYLPDAVESLTLGFRRGRLVRLEAVYSRDFSKKKPLERVVGDLSLQYGEPRRQDHTYFWWDSSTAMVASVTAQPAPSGPAVELRTTLAIMDRARFDPMR